VKNQVTKGQWVVRGVDRVDDNARQIYFRASGLYPDQDPYYVHYCRIKLRWHTIRKTHRRGRHPPHDYSPGGKYLLDIYSRVDLAPVTELRRAEDGTLSARLRRATPPRLPPRLAAAGAVRRQGRDGQTDIFGIIHRPTNFDENKKYPVIEDILRRPTRLLSSPRISRAISAAGAGRIRFHHRSD